MLSINQPLYITANSELYKSCFLLTKNFPWYPTRFGPEKNYPSSTPGDSCAFLLKHTFVKISSQTLKSIRFWVRKQRDNAAPRSSTARIIVLGVGEKSTDSRDLGIGSRLPVYALVWSLVDRFVRSASTHCSEVQIGVRHMSRYCNRRGLIQSARAHRFLYRGFFVTLIINISDPPRLLV